MRKYFSEFGLHVYSSHKAILPVEVLDDFDDDKKYHIYMILSFPKAFIKKDSIIKKEKGINLELMEVVNNKENIYEVKNFPLMPNINHKEIDIKLQYPYDKIKFQVKKEILEKAYGEEAIRKNKVKEPANIAIQSEVIKMYYYLQNFKPLRMDVLYIGKAYGKKGERKAQDRLMSHNTLQKILVDCHSRYPDKRIYLLLLEMSPLLNMTLMVSQKNTKKLWRKTKGI